MKWSQIQEGQLSQNFASLKIWESKKAESFLWDNEICNMQYVSYKLKMRVLSLRNKWNFSGAKVYERYMSNWAWKKGQTLEMIFR